MAQNPQTFVPQVSTEVPWHTRQHIQLIYQKLNNHAQAFANIADTISGSTTNNITEINQETGGGGGGGTPFAYPGLGGVNNQTGNTSYITQASDNGILIVLSDSSPVALTLNSALTTPYFCDVVNLGSGTATVTPSSGTINGLASIQLLQNQACSAYFDGTNWEAQIASFGTVTHSTTALTSGSVVIGNGAGDVKIAPIDYGITSAGVVTASAPVVINSPGTGGNVAFSVTNTATNGASWIFTATANGNSWAAQVTGSTAAPFRGYLFTDSTAGVINLLLSTVGGKAVASLLSTGMFGWYAGASPVSTALDTGLSRTAAATVSVGNGTPGDASGTLRAANLHATGAFSGTIVTAALTVGGTQGSITLVDGIITVVVAAT